MTRLQAALSFDGKSSYIEVGYQPQLNPSQFTISCWAKVEGNPGQWRSPVTSRTDLPTGGYILYAGQNNRWQFWIGDGSGWATLEGADIVLDRWTHVAATYEGTTLKFYLNGEPVGEPVESKIRLNTSCPLRIGAGKTEGDPGCFFNGKIAEVRLWDRARSLAEIQKYLNCRLTGNEVGLGGYWPLNEGRGTIAKDKTSHGNDGTILGATWGQAELPIAAVPAVSGKTAFATGLEDYGYWYRWKQTLPQSAGQKPFRRGRIWS